MQNFCNKCRKCARECLSQAIPFGDKSMYNGYEIWKPDIGKSTPYRVINPKGSACGRCLKMCLWNEECLLTHRFPIWLDDKMGYGIRTPSSAGGGAWRT